MRLNRKNMKKKLFTTIFQKTWPLKPLSKKNLLSIVGFTIGTYTLCRIFSWASCINLCNVLLASHGTLCLYAAVSEIFICMKLICPVFNKRLFMRKVLSHAIHPSKMMRSLTSLIVMKITYANLQQATAFLIRS